MGSVAQQTFVIALKELREAVRDRRSLFSGLFYGVWGPTVVALALMALARDRNDEEALTLAIRGSDHAPALTAFFAGRQVAIEPGGADLADRIRVRDIPVALEISGDYQDDFRAARPATVTLIYDASWTDSRTRADRIRRLLVEYATSVNDTRLILRGISPSAIAALDVAERDLSTPASRAGTVLATFPIFVLLAAFVGGMSVAADVTAGERERGSLEALLMNPVPRLALIGGKWIATAAVALATVTLTIAVSQTLLRHPRIQAIDLPVGLSAAEAMHIWLLLAPLALFATAVQLLMALHARTYKEAQTQLSLMLFLPMIPSFMFAFGSLRPALWMRQLPMLGQHLMVTDIVRGHIPDAASAVALTGMTLAATIAALGAASALLTHERIVRRLAG
jgi:sodium transport system permease protein